MSKQYARTTFALNNDIIIYATAEQQEPYSVRSAKD